MGAGSDFLDVLQGRSRGCGDGTLGRRRWRGTLIRPCRVAPGGKRQVKGEGAAKEPHDLLRGDGGDSCRVVGAKQIGDGLPRHQRQVSGGAVQAAWCLDVLRQSKSFHGGLRSGTRVAWQARIGAKRDVHDGDVSSSGAGVHHVDAVGGGVDAYVLADEESLDAGQARADGGDGSGHAWECFGE